MFSLPEALPDWVSVNQAAHFLGITPRRVRELVSSDRLRADTQFLGQSMLICREDLIDRKRMQPRAVKPLTSRSVRLVKDSVALEHGNDVSPLWDQAESCDRVRARQRATRLHHDDDPASLIRAWSLHEPAPQTWWAEHSQTGELTAYATGFSHPEAQLSAPSQLEVRLGDLPSWIRHDPAGMREPVQIIVHHDFLPCPEVRRVDAAFDLALHARSREDEAVKRLVQG